MGLKGQSAVEYIVTYGWALVALAIIITLLFYMNVFNPAAWVPVNNQAIGLSVFGVTDFRVNGSGVIALYVVNNAQAAVNLTDIKIQDASLVSPTRIIW